jgi:hypothetical protein
MVEWTKKYAAAIEGVSVIGGYLKKSGFALGPKRQRLKG